MSDEHLGPARHPIGENEPHKREHDGERVPSILFTKGGGGWLEAMATSGCDAVGVDWTVDLGAARARVGQRVSLQGNLDPAALLAEWARAIGATARLREKPKKDG